MRSETMLPALVLGLLLAPLAQGIGIPYPQADADPITVDLQEDAGGSLDWLVDVDKARDGGCLDGIPASTDASSAVAVLTKRVSAGTAPVIDLGLVRNTVYTETAPNTFESHTIFKGSLSVDTIRLVEGTWDLSLTVADRFGGTHDCTDDRTLEVTADDDASPVVEFPSADTDGIVRLHAGQALQPNVTDDLLGVVEYRVDRMPAGKFFALKAPYVVDSKSFFPGTNELTLRATDRAGNPVTEAKVTVLKDDTDPQVTLSFPRGETYYVGAILPVNVTVVDDSDYDVTVRLQGQTVQLTGLAGEKEFSVPLEGKFVGSSQLVVSVTDAFGNREDVAHLVNVTRLSSAARIVSATPVETLPIVGEAVHVKVLLEQADGLADINFTLKVSNQALGNLTVPADGENSTALLLKNILPGEYTFTVQAVADPSITLLDAVNLTREFDLEVFLARVHVGDDVYHLRTDARGLPNAVVGPDGTAYPLELVEKGKRSVYQWSVGNDLYAYDPAGPRDQEFKEEMAPADIDNDVPGLGLVVLLAALVGIAALARRRD